MLSMTMRTSDTRRRRPKSECCGFDGAVMYCLRFGVDVSYLLTTLCPN